MVIPTKTSRKPWELVEDHPTRLNHILVMGLVEVY